MKDFKIVLENEFSRRWNSKPQGGVYECFVCLCNRYNELDNWPPGSPHYLTFKEDRNGTIELAVDGKPHRLYADWNAVMGEWLLPREITVYAMAEPSRSWVHMTEGAPDAFYG